MKENIPLPFKPQYLGPQNGQKNFFKRLSAKNLGVVPLSDSFFEVKMIQREL